MFHYNEGARFYHRTVQNELRQLRQLWQVVRRIGKDKVKLARTRANELENIALDLHQVFQTSHEAISNVTLEDLFKEGMLLPDETSFLAPS